LEAGHARALLLRKYRGRRRCHEGGVPEKELRFIRVISLWDSVYYVASRDGKLEPMPESHSQC
jgi:hypothetical protein